VKTNHKGNGVNKRGQGKKIDTTSKNELVQSMAGPKTVVVTEDL